MTVQQMIDAIGDLNSILGSANLRPEEQDKAIAMKGELYKRLKANMMDAFRQRRWSEMERRTPGPFMGERLTGGPRNIPGSEGSGVVIQQKRTPATFIRDFVPNATNFGDRINIDPARLARKRSQML